MKKVLDFLEKNVQWIAIALGGIYLLWMVYSYVIKSPVEVSGIAADPLPPGKVDEEILKNAEQLDARIKNPAKDVVFPTPDFSKMLASITTSKTMPDLPSGIYNAPTASVLSTTISDPRGADPRLPQVG